jgi:hypothetical protein
VFFIHSVADPGFRIRNLLDTGSEMEKFGSLIWDKQPGYATPVIHITLENRNIGPESIIVF